MLRNDNIRINVMQTCFLTQNYPGQQKCFLILVSSESVSKPGMPFGLGFVESFCRWRLYRWCHRHRLDR